MATTRSKTCLIISDGPVPTPEHTKVEGGGLRCWGLAQGIAAAGGVDVTVAYNESYRIKPFTDSYEGVTVRTWNDEGIPALVSQYDTVIVSYCMGNLSLAVANAVSPQQQLVLDCYVPIYIEMSARKSANVEGEYKAFNFELDRWESVLRRGDAFLCANPAQKDFYEGVLAAVGRINPVTYGEDLIHVVPYGIYRDEAKATVTPISDGLRNKKALKLLWFGGIYPWFDLTELLKAVQQVDRQAPCELFVVGAKNPFNKHPDFLKKYDDIVTFIHDNGLDTIVHLIDWVDFKDRANWYLDSDVVVVVNEEGPENKLAWRTRLVDFMWADLPILTNGGDPLGELMLQKHAAGKLRGLSADEIAESIHDLATDKQRIGEYKKNIRSIRSNYYWDVVVQTLVDAIKQHAKASDLSFQTLYEDVQGSGMGRLAAIRSKAGKVPRYLRKYGAKTTALTAKTVIQTKLTKAMGHTTESREPKIIVISHQLDLSGAPYVLIDVVSEMMKQPALRPRVDFRTFNPVSSENIKHLNQLGIKPKIYHNKDRAIAFVPGDIVVLNSFAHSTVLLNSILSAVEKGTVKQLLWYAHEATPHGFLPLEIGRRTAKLLNEGRAHVYATAEDCRQKYIEFFGTDKSIIKMPYRFDMPAEEFRSLDAKQFGKLSFVLPGTVSDGRKGQMPVLYAFIDFYNNYYKPNPNAYRDFELTFVGLDKDFLSQQIILNGQHSLGKRFKHHPKVSRADNLRITKQANVTICYSLQEALPLFVYEGMAYGHPIIRNESSGSQEQLHPGKNGWAVSSDDYEGLVHAIEEVMNIDKTSNQRLAHMSEESVRLARKARENKYTLLKELK